MIQQNKIDIREAKPEDVSDILKLIQELAVYERLEQFVIADEEKIRKTIFGPDSKVDILIAEVDNKLAGQIIFFKNYSTFQAKYGVYIEDLYVRSEYRGLGVGSNLFKEVVSIAKREDCCKIEWAVLDWNKTAINFYEKIGAKEMKDWKIYQLSSSEFNSILDL